MATWKILTFNQGAVMTEDKVVQAVTREKMNTLEREQLKFDKRIDGVEDKIVGLSNQMNTLMSYVRLIGIASPFLLGMLAFILHQQPSKRLDVLEVKVEKVETSVNSLEIRFSNVEKSVDKLTMAVENQNEKDVK